MTQYSGQIGTLGQCTLPQEPGGTGTFGPGHLIMGACGWPSLEPCAPSNLSLEFLATLRYGVMLVAPLDMKTGSGAGNYPGATQLFNGPSKTCVCTAPLTVAHHPDSPPQNRA